MLNVALAPNPVDRLSLTSKTSLSLALLFNLIPNAKPNTSFILSTGSIPSAGADPLPDAPDMLSAINGPNALIVTGKQVKKQC